MSHEDVLEVGRRKADVMKDLVAKIIEIVPTEWNSETRELVWMYHHVWPKEFGFITHFKQNKGRKKESDGREY